MGAQVDELSIAKRRVLLRDSLGILSLIAITCVLFVFTLLLFRSFTSHRAELAQRWSDRGRRALRADRPDEAVADLRTALTYAPDTRDYELLLAEALARAGHLNEAYNYFLGLWQSRPGDGVINLYLARLSAGQNKSADAINYYRAAIYGTWSGDGVAKRATTRMELAQYLMDQHDLQAARTELLIIGGNTPDEFGRDMKLGDLLQQAGDPADAYKFYAKAIALQPDNVQALESAARLAYASGDYANANHLLLKAEIALAHRHPPAQLAPADAELMHNAGRLLQLMPDPMRPRERVGRILADRAIARQRFDTCSTQLGARPASGDWQALAQQWAAPDASVTASVLTRDPERQDRVLRLVYDTEIAAQKSCSESTSDDALLLKLASSSYGITQPEAKSTSNGKPGEPR